MIVHLVDGTYELFRYFYGLRWFTKYKDRRYEARLIETHSLPSSLSASRRGFCVDHSHCLMLAPATLAALPSTRAIPNRDVFCLTAPIGSAADRLFVEVIGRMDRVKCFASRGLVVLS